MMASSWIPPNVPHQHGDPDITQYNVSVRRRDGIVAIERIRTCGRIDCQTILEDPVRFRNTRFPTTSNGWRLFVGAVFGNDAWESLGQAYAQVRRGQKKRRMHMMRDPLNYTDLPVAVCDNVGRRIDPSRITASPPEVNCYGCRQHPRFLAIWVAYRKKGAEWAMAEPDGPPTQREVDRLLRAWGSP